ncbi:MAG: hypothetical protein HY722_16495 [Planctomycetes bacterium]|nr:hypothetical protein [Planctomycetota bacterium]
MRDLAWGLALLGRRPAVLAIPVALYLLHLPLALHRDLASLRGGPEATSPLVAEVVAALRRPTLAAYRERLPELASEALRVGLRAVAGAQVGLLAAAVWAFLVAAFAVPAWQAGRHGRASLAAVALALAVAAGHASRADGLPAWALGAAAAALAVAATATVLSAFYVVLEAAVGGRRASALELQVGADVGFFPLSVLSTLALGPGLLLPGETADLGAVAGDWAGALLLPVAISAAVRGRGLGRALVDAWRARPWGQLAAALAAASGLDLGLRSLRFLLAAEAVPLQLSVKYAGGLAVVLTGAAGAAAVTRQLRRCWPQRPPAAG